MDHPHPMLSDKFIAEHRDLVSRHMKANTLRSTDQRGARDAVTDPRVRSARDNTRPTPFTKSMSATRGDKRKGARDQWNNPSDEPPEFDKETVRALLSFVAEQDGELAERLAAILNLGGEEGAEGEEVAQDVPGPTEGTPRPGGTNWPYEREGEHLAGDAGLAYDRRFPGVRARVGVEPDYRPAGSTSRFDAFGRPIDGRPPARNSRSGRHGRSEATLALDARSENNYAVVWPDAMRIGVL